MPTGLPYELPIQTGLTVANGASKTFKIKHPNRVRLARLRVQQTDGATGNFTVDIFNAQVGDSPVLADKLYQVTPDGGITQTGAGYIDYDFTGENVVFVNQDADVFVNTGLGWRSQPSSQKALFGATTFGAR